MLDALLTGCIDFGECLCGVRARSVRRRCGGQFDVCCVVIFIADRNCVLARFRQDMKFVGGTAADGAGVRLHGPELESDTGKDALISVEHDLVGFL